MLLAQISTHSSEINWSSVAVILGGFAAILTVIQGWQEKRYQSTRNEVTNAVNNLSEVLQAKLETKETVRQISERLARLEGATSAVHLEHTREPG